MKPNQVKQFFVKNKILALLIAIAIIWFFFHLGTDGAYVTPRNMSNLFRQMAITGMLACGMVFVIIAGEIDLSVGSLLGLLGGVAAILTVNMDWPVAVAVTVTLIAGVVVGGISGLGISKLKVPSFIIGLGGMLAFRGILLGVTDSTTIGPVPTELGWLGQGLVPPALSWALVAAVVAVLVMLMFMRRKRQAETSIPVASLAVDLGKVAGTGALLLAAAVMLNSAGGVPVPVMILLVLLAVFTYVGSQTVFGRHIYAIGGNMEAARMSGINVGGVKVAVFAIMGLMCAFAGIINTARLASGSPSAGVGGELDAIAACFIGGTSMRGGVGTVYGALVGALMMASLDNGMSMMDVDAYWQMIVKGGILVLAVWVDVLSGSDRG